MEVSFYINNSDAKKAYKNLTSKQTFAVNHFRLKEPVDQLHPVLLIKKEAFTIGWAGYNYAQIPAFGNRKYFARFVAENAGMQEWQLDVDSLSTYADQLCSKTQAFELERAQSNKGKALKFPDAERPIQADKYTAYRVIGNLDETSGGIYTLTVAGGAARS